MKTLFSIILACTLQHTYAQVQRVDSVYNILMQASRPSIKAWVANTAAKYKNKEVNESSIKATEDFSIGQFYINRCRCIVFFGNGTSGKK
jgi:hypothetical protein